MSDRTNWCPLRFPRTLAFLGLGLLGLSAHAQSPGGSGPFPAAMMADASLPSHTLYRPVDLASVERLPVVLWGNGGCANSSFSYQPFLREVASHGFLVIAVGPYRETPPPRERRNDPPGVWPPLATFSRDLIAGLEWALRQNETVGSEYYGRVDTDNVATMGHSCGGVQAVEAGQDQRVKTVVLLNSGLIDADDPFMQRFDVDRSVFDEWQKPIAYFIGGEEDIAHPNALEDWAVLKAPAVLANLPVGHGGTFGEPNGGAFAIGPLSWLKWQLQGDHQAARMFLGECRLCQLGGWTVETKGLD